MLTKEIWHEIEKKIASMIARRGEYFVRGHVVKNDPARMLVWIQEIDGGTRPVPVCGYEYLIEDYDETPKGTNYGAEGTPAKYRTRKTVYIARPICPEPGQIVLVAKQLGASRLPVCLGVIIGRKHLKGVE